jgi:CubicO group peptidase (beta-lactamase class C family)
MEFDSLQNRLGAGDIPNFHSKLVIQHEQMIAEWYFEGTDETWGMWLGTIKFDLETLHDVRSVTKSIISLLFGIAMADHAIVSLDSPVLDYFPEYKDLQTSERRKIRLRDLLPMTSGLHWEWVEQSLWGHSEQWDRDGPSSRPILVHSFPTHRFTARDTMAA